MTLDLPPLTAFALEGSGAAALAVGSVHTLTLAVTEKRQRWDGPAGAGKLGPGREAKLPSLRAAVVPSALPTITLTF